MTTPGDDAGDDTQSCLRRLVLRGFQFLHPRDATGELLAVIGVRAHHHVIDVLRLHAEDDAVATRMPGDEVDILAPRRTLWQVSGQAPKVLAGLLALPDAYPAGNQPRLAGDEKPAASRWLAPQPILAGWLAHG
jgi:hypothetical protein